MDVLNYIQENQYAKEIDLYVAQLLLVKCASGTMMTMGMSNLDNLKVLGWQDLNTSKVYTQWWSGALSTVIQPTADTLLFSVADEQCSLEWHVQN